MAEIWPRLRKKLSLACDVRRGRRGKKSSGAASRKKVSTKSSGLSGLEKCVALLRGMQSRKSGASSLVERTGASVSAARSLSRSAQEWTASTLARTAYNRRELGSKSPDDEIVLLHCAVQPSDANQTRSTDFVEPGVRCVMDQLEEKSSQLEVSENVIVRDREVDRLIREDMSLGRSNNLSTVDGASPPSVDIVLRRVKRTGRRVKQTSNSAFVVLVALGAFIFSRVGRAVNPLAAALAFNAAAPAWRTGEVYARLMFSLVASFLFSPLRSYLTSCCSRRLSLLPRKLEVIADANSLFSATGVSRSVDVASEGSGGCSLEIIGSVPPLKSAAITQLGAASALSLTLLAIPESVETPASPAIEPGAATDVVVKDGGGSSPSRRLAKKFSSRLKKLKMLRSSSSSSSPGSLLSAGNSDSPGSLLSPCHSPGASESGSPTSPSPHSPALSSPDRHRKCPFSRRLHKPKPETSPLSELAEVHGDDEVAAHATTEKKLSSSCKKSRLCKMSSTESLSQDIRDVTTDTTPTSSLMKETSTLNPSRRVSSRPVMALLVTLVFLLVGRLPAILATSLFLVVISNTTHHDRAHSRSRGREASEAARKLHRSLPPRRHPNSPPRR